METVQKQVLRVLKENSETIEDFFVKKTISRLTDEQIYKKIDTKPVFIVYINRTLKNLEKKGFIKRDKEIVKGAGTRRIIYIL